MAEDKTNSASPTGAASASREEFQKLLENDNTKIPQVGDTVKGAVISASKAEVRLDIDGIVTGIVRGRELYFEAEEYANLQPGDEVEATVIEVENENGELELSFRHAGQQKAWDNLVDSFTNKKIIKVKVVDANKGGVLVNYGQMSGFLPVSQLAPENYPRINGGDKGKILEKLRSFIGADFEVKVMALDDKEEKFVASEKEAWQERQQHIISQYKVGSVVEGDITALTNFGVFVSFGENLEGLIHISELAWQRIDDPSDIFKVGQKIKAEIISIDGSKIFLSAKKLISDPWKDVAEKYKTGQVVLGTIIKVNPFGLFVELDKDIHGLAHISQLGLEPGQKINDLYKIGGKQEFTIVSIEPKDHRLGLVRVEAAAPEKKHSPVQAAAVAALSTPPEMPPAKKTRNLKHKTDQANNKNAGADDKKTKDSPAEKAKKTKSKTKKSQASEK